MQYLITDCNISEQRVQNIIKKMQTKYTNDRSNNNLFRLSRLFSEATVN